MPYKVLDSAGISIKHTLEQEFNFLEAEGWDFLSALGRFAIFHRPLEKPKKPVKVKEPKNATGTSAIPATNGSS